MSKPSIKFCEKGMLDEGEKYHPDLHNYGTTLKERCPEYYEKKRQKRLQEARSVAEVTTKNKGFSGLSRHISGYLLEKDDVPGPTAGGKRKSRRNRKSKKSKKSRKGKSKKNRRKSNRRR